MLTTVEASDAIAKSMPPFAPEEVPVAAATGRVLRQSVHAERDQPPFDRVMMDGIAIRHAAFAAGERHYTISGTLHAGDPEQTLDDPSACIEVMTGAVMPVGADCVIPVERVSTTNGIASIEADYEAQPRQFVHGQGSDHRKGAEVLSPGGTISPMDIAIIASCGLPRVLVSRLPVVRVISTGNELVPAGQAIAPHQIRMSNGPALVAMLAQQGFIDCAHDHLVDDRSILADRIAAHLQAADILILSGGVSMGKADFVPGVLTSLGVDVVFHRISQRPGKPMWFGMGKEGQAVFALPGNPVSSLVCCRQYVLPALFSASGRRPRPLEHAILEEAVIFRPELTNFLPVSVRTDDDGRLLARPVPTNTSGDFTALSGTDGYVELLRDRSEFEAGSPVPLHRWSQP
jgi:molybdopterin molybdotransferase